MKQFILWLLASYRGKKHDPRRGSNHVSFLLRRKLEKFDVRQIVGVNLAGLAFFGAVVVPQAGALTSNVELSLQTPQTIIDTAPSDTYFQWPLSHFGISNWFSFTHPGLDLTTPVGTPVYPIAQGKVEWTNILNWGYGQHILIKHEKDIQSLYAHLSKIRVTAGQEVSKATVIGEVGTSGWTTGPHLHLEVYQNGTPVNPVEILPEIKK
ncbi:M23 family metallopeptidase [Candidatus Gottesmanbacteria bacterium]|nr:M23 family metallopeptidase [Candidatus Gottesmanbacteria bacterium]